MSAAGDYRAGVERLLRDDYRVDALRFDDGSQHPYCAFEYSGRRFRVTLNNLAGRKSDNGNLLAMKLQDIRRLLGTPPPAGEDAGRERKTLTQMTEQLNADAAPLLLTRPVDNVDRPAVGAPASVHGVGRVARYAGTWPRLRFELPAAVADAWGAEGKKYRVRRTAPRTWEIVTCLADAKSRGKISANALNAGDPSLWRDEPEPWGNTPAEYLLVDGTVLCTLARGPLPSVDAEAGRALAAKRTAKRRQRPTADAEVAAPQEVPSPVAAPQEIAPPTRVEIAACLAGLRRIEAETPYRLVKLRSKDGAERWVFDAGRIE